MKYQALKDSELTFSGHGKSLDFAIKFLHEHLGDGFLPAKGIIGMALSHGISESTLRRAKKHLRVKSRKSPHTGTFFWVPNNVVSTLKYALFEQDILESRSVDSGPGSPE